jgi:hypothetical protein
LRTKWRGLYLGNANEIFTDAGEALKGDRPQDPPRRQYIRGREHFSIGDELIVELSTLFLNEMMNLPVLERGGQQ